MKRSKHVLILASLLAPLLHPCCVLSPEGYRWPAALCGQPERAAWLPSSVRGLPGDAAGIGAVRVLAASLKACFCKPLLPRPLWFLPSVIAAERMGSVYAVAFRLAGLCRTGLAGRHPGEAISMGLLLLPSVPKMSNFW